MKQSPSQLFRILTTEDEKEKEQLTRKSVDEVRLELEHAKPSSGGNPDEQAGRHVNAAQAALRSASGLSQGLSQGTEEPGVNEAVLENMLGSLYVPHKQLSDFEDIAAGGFATVQRATLRHVNGMSQTVAVKQLLESRVSSKQDLKDFAEEANLWRKLRSQDVVKLVGIGAQDLTSFETITSSLYIVCEYMEGGTLREVVERQMLSGKKQVYTFSDVFRWFIGVSRAVKYLHSCRPAIVHRDLKPENIALTLRDTTASAAKVLDLGLHMRRDARLVLPGELEGSWYGGSVYDAAQFNGSVRTGQTLADKVKAVEAAGMDIGVQLSPNGSAGSKNNSGNGTGTALRPILEERALSLRSSNVGNGSQHGAQVEANGPASPKSSYSANASWQSNTLDPKAGTPAGGAHGPAGPGDAQTGQPRGATAGGKRGLGGGLGAGRDAIIKSGSQQSLASSGGKSPSALTTKVGSWLYMAPEMVKGNKYNEKVDVYSMAVMLFEALVFRLNVMKLAMGGEPEAIRDYAESVAKGHREKIPSSWPKEVSSLLENAWHQDQKLRITAKEFLQRVSSIIDSGVAHHMDENCQPYIYKGTAECNCCSIM